MRRSLSAYEETYCRRYAERCYATLVENDLIENGGIEYILGNSEREHLLLIGSGVMLVRGEEWALPIILGMLEEMCLENAK